MASSEEGLVRFVYVAATQEEAKQFTDEISGYHPGGGPFWKPYLPPVENSIGAITQPLRQARASFQMSF